MFEQEIVFGKFLKVRRKQLKLTIAQLVSKIGYKNISKGIRRIADIENGKTEPELTGKIMLQLGVTQEDRKRCEKQEALHKKQLIEKLPKFKPVLVWRAMACVYMSIELPENFTSQQDMIHYASEIAKTRKSNCCLKLDYDLRYWINKNGEIGKADRRIENMPTAKPNIGVLLNNGPQKEEEKSK